MEIKREKLLQKLIHGMSSPFIKVIVGVRRCGKSYLLFHIFVDYLKSIGVKEDHIIKIQFDKVSDSALRNPLALSKYLKERIKEDGEKYYLLLDEIQECVKVVNPSFLDENGKLIPGIHEDEKWLTYHDVLNEYVSNDMVDCYVTGSNSRFLSSDLPTEFRNRNYNIEVYPLSFSEIKAAFPNKELDDLWNDYYTYGGMPLAILDENPVSRQQYLKDLLYGTYLKDIKERYHLLEDNHVDQVLDVVASSIGSPLNPGKIETIFQSKGMSKTSDNTISNYLTYLENSFLIKEAKRYDVKGRKYIGTLSKYYFVDPGLRNARLNFRQTEENHLMENIIYLELIRKGYSVDVGIVHSWKGTEKRERVDYEVDFIVNQGDRKYYIQSVYDMSSEEKKKQEQNSLRKITDSFKKIIIVKGYRKPYYNENGILILGLFNFLLDETAMEY